MRSRNGSARPPRGTWHAPRSGPSCRRSNSELLGHAGVERPALELVAGRIVVAQRRAVDRGRRTIEDVVDAHRDAGGARRALHRVAAEQVGLVPRRDVARRRTAIAVVLIALLEG